MLASVKRIMAFSAATTILLIRVNWLSQYPVNHFVKDTMLPGLDQPYSYTANGLDLNAPYGITWVTITWLLDTFFVWLPFPREVRFWIGSLIVDQALIFTIALYRGRWLLIYGPISFFQWVNAPWNLPVIWITVLGLKFWGALPLAILTKLPFGGPIDAWSYALNMGQTWHRGVDSWELYGSLGILWVSVLISQMLKTVQSQKTRCKSPNVDSVRVP